MDAEALVLHQVHWAKLAADAAAEVVSLPLIWTGRRSVGLVVHFLTPAIASAALFGADTKHLRSNRRGRYVLSTCLRQRKLFAWWATR
ncbi:hypothetical protein [Mycobacterium noviomagense]|uniref:Uncharacterized protein n=1 Tax=Mycobacterium noviomagense TaxID=459858 RepID=A0A7I7PJH4_9MYCO|nr:hypothetical protein [Mycobacterium noviomagense]ORB10957.1 hypothetical protein BST37_21610 [Mycobacterium noviomagense]BBY08721.1 hypothetical protein MNVI_40390 [Mycobacterium noviomagense]